MSKLSIIPSSSLSVGHMLTTILFDRKVRFEHSKIPSSLYEPAIVGLNTLSVKPVGIKFPNSSSFSHLILSKFSILVPVKIMLDSPFCFIQEPKTSNSTSYIISGGSAKPE